MKEDQSEQAIPKPWYFKPWEVLVSFLLVIVLVWLIGLNMWLWNPDPFPEDNEQAANPFATDVDDDPSWGPLNSGITIISFQDFTCSACAQAYQAMKQLRENYLTKIHFVFRDFPIIGANSTVAAMAAECADDQGKFWEMHDKLFENQERISKEYVKAFAAQIGLDMMDFNECYDSNKYLNEIRNDFNEGLAAGATATPTYFVNGTRVEGAFSYDVWAEVIESI